MKWRTWLVFCVVQLVGCILTSYGTVYFSSSFVRGSWVGGFLLLFPGYLPAMALEQRFVVFNALIFFFPVAIASNAILWVACSAAWRILRQHKSGMTSRRYGITIIGTSLAFVAANVFHFLRPVTCFDCFFPYGVPFTLYRDGGDAGGGGIEWRGLAADAAIAAVTAVLLGGVWQWFAARRSS